VRELLATDISPTALGRAEERCRSVPNVAFMRLDLAKEPLPPGPFDLIVASEVLYYLKDKRDLARVARKIADALAPGGHFLTAHAVLVVDDPTTTGFDWPVGFGATTINATFAAVRDLEPVRELRTSLYQIGLFRKREAEAVWHPKLAPEVLEREANWPETPGVAGQINVGGAELTLRDAYDMLVTRSLPMLMYHRIAADGPQALAPCRVHPERFEAQLDWLKRYGFRSVGLDTWRRSVEKDFGELPGRAVCLTFDDGYEDFAEVAWPLLQSYGFGATVFLVSDLVGQKSVWNAAYGPPAPLMGWDTVQAIARESRALRQLGREGVVFGSHTATHLDLTRVGPERLVDELRRSKVELEGRLGAEMTAFAYPFGYLDGLTRNAVEASGYQLAVTSCDGRARYGSDLFLLPRITVAGGDDLLAFARKLDLREPAPLLRRLHYARARQRGAVRPSR
jgi:peptidoglycan/xylan/chitin deacetylase (PgdA/CDA1 family)